jgi:hypothetical protein
MMTEKQINTIQKALEFNFTNRKKCVVKVDHKAKVCVAVTRIKGKTSIGVSRCNSGDTFIKPIGIAIATYRAMGKKVPQELLRF